MSAPSGTLLHEGGMARLYAVEAPAGEVPRLLKRPRLEFGSHPGCLVGFEMEQMILGRLAGPHVPRLIAAGSDDEGPWLLMERIEGESFAAIAARAPLPAAEVARLVGAAASAVHDLHRQNVIHLDVKPENLLLRDDGTAVLVDFGIARHAELPDLVGEEFRLPAGSGIAISPEQLAGNRSDPRSDIFALGVLAYRLATGALPFGNPATRLAMHRRLYADPPPPRALAPPLARMLRAFEREGFAPWAAAYARRDALFGQPVQTTLPQAPDGVADGVDTQGMLWLRRGAARVPVGSGEVSLRRVDAAHAGGPAAC